MDVNSIVLRNTDGEQTGKIYVDGFGGAARLAARFRNACNWVDVINADDVITHRWEGGNPDWENTEALSFHRAYDPYDFERRGDKWWEPENRVMELSEILVFAFGVAIGEREPTEQTCLELSIEADQSLVALILEADDIRQQTPTDNIQLWAETIADWMCNADLLFLRYRVECQALAMRFDLNRQVQPLLKLPLTAAKLEAEMTLGRRGTRH